MVKAVEEGLGELARRAGIAEWTHEAFRETGGEEIMADWEQGASRAIVHVLFGKRADKAPGPNLAVVKATEVSGRLIASEIQYSKS